MLEIPCSTIWVVGASSPVSLIRQRRPWNFTVSALTPTMKAIKYSSNATSCPGRLTIANLLVGPASSKVFKLHSPLPPTWSRAITTALVKLLATRRGRTRSSKRIDAPERIPRGLQACQRGATLLNELGHFRSWHEPDQPGLAE